MALVNHNHVNAVSPFENVCPSQNSISLMKKPIRLRNVATKAEAFDSLHMKTKEVSKIVFPGANLNFNYFFDRVLIASEALIHYSPLITWRVKRNFL